MDWLTKIDLLKDKWDKWNTGADRRRTDETQKKLDFLKQQKAINKKDPTPFYIGLGILSLLALIFLILRR